MNCFVCWTLVFYYASVSIVYRITTTRFFKAAGPRVSTDFYKIKIVFIGIIVDIEEACDWNWIVNIKLELKFSSLILIASREMCAKNK